MKTIVATTMLTAALLGAVPCARAQDAPAPGEAARLQERITQLQREAMADPALRPATDSINVVLHAAMARLDPLAPEKVASARAVNAELAAAHAANDNARLNQLATAANELNAYFARIRPRAMAEADVEAARQGYIARVFERMKQLDPDVQQYVDRLTAIRESQAQRIGGRR